MGRKSSAKARVAVPPPGTPEPPKTSKTLLLGLMVLVVVGLGGVALWRGRGAAAPPPAQSATDEAAKKQPKEAPATPQAEEAARRALALGPHKQDQLPPVPFRDYAPPRPPQVVVAAFQFAAEHPEVLSYVPCFCGCERSGHNGNEDCFVHQRAPNGDVVAWEEHGVECAVCIDVATRSRQMHASGASVRDIRAAIEKEFGTRSPTMTPTPKPPPATTN